MLNSETPLNLTMRIYCGHCGMSWLAKRDEDGLWIIRCEHCGKGA